MFNMYDQRWNRGSTLALSLTSALDAGGWLTARPGRFTPGKETLCPLNRSVGEPRVVLDGCRKFAPHWDSTPGVISR